MVTGGGERLLESLGLSQAEEDVYLHMLREQRATVAEIGAATGMTRSRSRTVIGLLENKGLVARGAGKPATYFTTAPEIALRALAHRQREQIDVAHGRAEELVRSLFERARSGADDVIEIVPPGEGFAVRVAQLFDNAERDVMVLSRPPYILSYDESDEANARVNAKVRRRFIYDRSALELPGHIEVIERDIAAGEEARLLPTLPMKLSIVDRQIAHLPLATAGEQPSDWVMVRPSSILDAFVILFEKLWDQAVPLRFGAHGGVPESSDDIVDPEVRRLLGLLAAGLTDEAIGRELGISSRSVRRKVAEVMRKLQVKNRFQAGVEATRRGWLGDQARIEALGAQPRT